MIWLWVVTGLVITGAAVLAGSRGTARSRSRWQAGEQVLAVAAALLASALLAYGVFTRWDAVWPLAFLAAMWPAWRRGRRQR